MLKESFELDQHHVSKGKVLEVFLANTMNASHEIPVNGTADVDHME